MTCTFYTWWFQLWKHAFAQVIFDTDPAPKGKMGMAQVEEMSQAMIRSDPGTCLVRNMGRFRCCIYNWYHAWFFPEVWLMKLETSLLPTSCLQRKHRTNASVMWNWSRITRKRMSKSSFLVLHFLHSVSRCIIMYHISGMITPWHENTTGMWRTSHQLVMRKTTSL